MPISRESPPTRRSVLRGVALGTATGLVNPRLLAAAETLDTVTIQTGEYGETVSAAIAMPETVPAPGIVLVHEWWGLNDEIKAMAVRLAEEGYVALAIDLYGGKVARTREEARSLMQRVDQARGEDIVATWPRWLAAHDATTDRIGVVGWCFGGGWSLTTGLVAPVDAVVVYYGNVARSADQLRSLNAPVLGHFATEDTFIDREMVDGFTEAMAAAGKSLTVHWYEADHAFANPSGARYDAEDARLAWERTLAFFDAHLRPDS